MRSPRGTSITAIASAGRLSANIALMDHLIRALCPNGFSNSLWNLIAGQGLPFETLCIASCLTTVVVVTGGLAVGHGVFEGDPGDLERLQECRCRVAEHLVGVSAAA